MSKDTDWKELDQALREILLAPRGGSRSENREPTREELNQRWKLERREAPKPVQEQ